MENKELQRLLSYFSEKLTVCIEDHSIGKLVPIDNVTGEVEKDTGKFIVRVHINGRRN